MRNATQQQYPRWAIWENVPGAFSSAAGDDFEAVIKEMVDCGASLVEWATLDAQFFGVPQRRRRVFVIACFDTAISDRGGRPVLAVSEGGKRNTSKSKPSRESVASETSGSVGTDSEPFRMRAFGDYTDDDCASAIKARDYKDATDLVVENGGQWAAGSTDDDVLRTSVCSKWAKGTGGPSGSEYYNLVVSNVVDETSQSTK
jgi:DNA (cytosine-5)-methyltransferase 1